MPASFDRATVGRLLADIDKPYNASALKIGYFLRRGQPELPVLDGFELLQAAAQAEPVGTNKWFRLQNLLAFAAFRVPGADTSQGMDAYETLFNHAADAGKVNAAYTLRESIGEFVSAVPGRFNDFGLSRDERTKALLLRAWAAYAVALSAPMNGAVIDEPNWTRALQKSESLEAFVPAVETLLDDAKLSPSFGLLVAAAQVMAPTKPDKALALWERAKPMIPLRDGKAEVNEAARLYVPLVQWLAAGERLPDAIANQREFVALTGRGQARLMLLLRQSGDEAATAQALASLGAANGNEAEIEDAAAGLLQLAYTAKTPDAGAKQQAVALLETYLAAPRARDMASELYARLRLANAYLRDDRLAEAERVLVFAEPTPQQQRLGRVRSLLREAERLKARLQKASETAKVEEVE